MTTVSVAGLTVTTKDKKVLLDDVSLTFRPGKLTAIIAPTGAGKSTLLNAISGRCGLDISGTVALNGAVVDPRKCRNRFGYVMSSDSLFGTLTPREAFRFAFHLTSRQSISRYNGTSQSGHVAMLLDELRLTHCADTLIGNAQIKGLSSGERKRVAVGLEMIHEPEIMAVDESTSGLDSFSAQVLVDLLKRLTKAGSTVIATIHQPSSKIFQMFDDVVFMYAGKIGYAGPVSEVSKFFALTKYPCGLDSNPADHAMFLLQTLPTAEWTQMARILPAEGGVDDTAVKADDVGTLEKAGAVSAWGGRARFWRQVLELTKREARNFLRDRDAMKARLTVSILLTVIISLVYWQIGDNTTSSDVDLSHIGAITLIAVNCMFANSQLLLLSFPLERPVFMREYSSGLYSSVAYAVSKWLIEWPVLFVQICLQVLIGYFMMGLRGSYIGIVYACFLITVASSSVALLVSALASDARQALEAAPIIFVPQIYYTGFFLESLDQMPAVLRWGHHLCSLKYGLNIAILAEFEKFVPGVDSVFKRFDISPDSEWWYALILVLVTLVFRILAIFALKSRSFYV